LMRVLWGSVGCTILVLRPAGPGDDDATAQLFSAKSVRTLGGGVWGMVSKKILKFRVSEVPFL
jgi:hypothetical protein